MCVRVFANFTPDGFLTAQFLAQPNVVEVYNWAETDKSLVIVMELIEGIELGEYVYKKRPLSELDILLIGWQLLFVLAHLAKLHVVHLDLKPKNIMIEHFPDTQPLVKVVDFGVAKDLLASAPVAAPHVAGQFASHLVGNIPTAANFSSSDPHGARAVTLPLQKALDPHQIAIVKSAYSTAPARISALTPRPNYLRSMPTISVTPTTRSPWWK
ncbi:kinase-like domain-containing protein [Catenaria anguillulae PL171]|uniref:Kinase-like domain-containing protein n=1 Tax=Catenaria anguillulae PL171 TaxID=765915 RepID=A0A1Y2HZS3_9FUNG|nr:kinase-like domain-containing protein [Catenaria anguillulae PL171]